MRTENILDFGNQDSTRWMIVNDGVMGGLSRSGIEINDSGTAVFQGTLSLENNGGFASVRAVIGLHDLSSFEGLEVRLRGDGRTYQVRLRTDDGFDGIAYRADVRTRAGEWLVQFIPFEDFVPTFRGRTSPQMPPLDVTRIHQVGFLLADKNPGDFVLEIDSLRARSHRQAD